MRRVAALVIGLAGFAGAFTGAATAHAHAELESVSPLDGAMLTSLPSVVELTFTEPVGKPADIVVLGPDQQPLATGDTTTVDRVLGTTLEPTASAVDGWYTVSYQVTSADGHMISGTSTFMLHVGGDTATADELPGRPGATGTPTTADPWVVGALLAALAVALVLALGAVRRLLVSPPGTAS